MHKQKLVLVNGMCKITITTILFDLPTIMSWGNVVVRHSYWNIMLLTMVTTDWTADYQPHTSQQCLKSQIYVKLSCLLYRK